VFNLDPAKLLIIALVAVILLGPDKLPQVARQAGAAWRTFNDFRHRMESEVRSSIPDLPSSTDIARLARSPSALLDHLSHLAPDDEPASKNGGENGNGNGNGTSADVLGAESSVEAATPTGSANGSGEGNAAGHPPTTSVPPTSTIPTPPASPSVSPGPTTTPTTTPTPTPTTATKPAPGPPPDPSPN